MHHNMTTSFRTQHWLYLFLFIHLLVWTFTPAFVRYNLPLDAIEGVLWGHQLEWGYDKNPYLNGWLTALATHLDGHTGYLVYFFSQLCVVTCLWATWQLAKKIVPPLYAFAAVLLLESIQYFNLHAIDFNDNTLELGLWAVTIYYFYQSLSTRKSRANTVYWIITGLFAGLSLMAKYYTLVLLTGMTLCLLIPTDNRNHWKTRPLYWGLLTFLIVITPHIVWLFSHNFITVRYVFARASNASTWTNHLFYPIQFAWQQTEAFAPALIPFLFLFIGSKPFFTSPKIMITTFNRSFLFFVGVVPFLLTLLLSLLFGITLRAGWGMPLLSTWGILLIAVTQPNLTQSKIIKLFIFNIFLLIALACGYSFSLIHSSTPSSANFPGREIAQRLTQQWHDTYHTSLAYVAGSRWVGGNINLYSADHPAIFVEWNTQRAPWINLQDMRKKGALFVWDINEEGEMPERIRQQFPTLQKNNVLEFTWHRNKNIAPVKIGVAVLPPED